MIEMNESEFDMLMSGVLERAPERMADDELVKMISVTQAATDRLLNEYEARGMLQWFGGAPVIPYIAPESRMVETVLTRPGR